MKLAALSSLDVSRRLTHGGLKLRVDPFTICIRSDIPGLASDIALMYGEFECDDIAPFSDFHVEVLQERGIRRWVRPLARFFFDGRPSFVPLPVQQAFPMLEWGLNWCVAAHSHQYLVIHAAVVERNGFAALLPAPPGSGKSTLCAALILRGWRLLSDELALLDMQSGQVFGMARPISLKNRSIDIIRDFDAKAVLTTPVPDTAKGTLALMQPPADSVARIRDPASPRWIVTPQYRPQSELMLEPEPRASTFLLIAQQSFNYEIHGQKGFERLTHTLDDCQTLRITYSRLDDAIQAFESLAAQAHG